MIYLNYAGHPFKADVIGGSRRDEVEVVAGSGI